MKGLMFGPSMKPAMGMINFVSMELFDFIGVGDVVCFSRKNSLTRLIHRVINIDSSGIVYIKGDNAREIDCVPLSMIYYKIIKFKKIL